MSIKKSFTATGTSDKILALQGAFQISGTFVGTVELQRFLNGVWQAIGSFTAPTAAGDQTSFDNGVSLPMRFEVTAYTSGTINVSLNGKGGP